MTAKTLRIEWIQHRSNASLPVVLSEEVPSSSSRSKMMQRGKSFLSDFVAGGVSGIAAKTSCAPFDRIKLLLQTQHINPSLTRQYVSTWDCTVRIFREEGVLAFWRGNLANAYRYFPSQALNFAFKDQYKLFFGNQSTQAKHVAGTTNYNLLFLNLFSGGLAGASAMIICYPFELARTRLATDVGREQIGSSVAAGGSRQFSGTWDCLRAAYRQGGGIRGLYDGLAISITGAILFRALFMGGYDFAKHELGIEEGGLMARIAAAQVVTTTVGTVCYPLDTIKRRMMVQRQMKVTVTSAALYRNSWDCCLQIIRKEGSFALFNGYTANLLRGFSGPILLVGYDELKKLMR